MTANPGAATPNPSGDRRSASSDATEPKPRIALFIATAAGIGYIPLAPGTWGSLLGVALAWGTIHVSNINMRLSTVPARGSWTDRAPEANFFVNECVLALCVALLGTWAAHRVAKHLCQKDPQKIVIDEVSGQLMAYLGLFMAGPIPHYWKYLLLGFILFRAFDIWKPFPIRQVESLAGGWGIMADDWVAGIYAAIGLGIARSSGL
jgi:phosphatidylglycerophosphatase A